MIECQTAVDLVVTIVDRGCAEAAVKAASQAGVQGSTILLGKGTGIHEHLQILGIPIHPEKEIVLTLVAKKKTPQFLEAINSKLKLEKPGHGLAFVVDVDRVIGICHEFE